jgi:cobalamin synthase
MKSFLKKNFSIYHLIGVVLGFIFSFVYWKKSGQYSESVLKNNLILVSAWGVLTGYMIFDLIKSSVRKKEGEG